ncbi:MAG: hypothetical protein M1828_002934 [Chrysothrix sp. TS-e1954]|nr:MAG: hypothetical protein M1828_002934 [Chrysothrix sp. TS-e1954]
MSRKRGLWLLLLGLVASGTSAQDNDNTSTPLSHYYSRPDLEPPAMDVTLQNFSFTEPGYVFITPYQVLQAGPYIYDKRGNLVWSGFGSAGPWNAHNLHPCEFRGSTHLCMFQGNQQPGYARGHAVILNTNYEIVQTVESGNGYGPADQHEFKLTHDGEAAMITIYNQIPYDLSRLGVTKSQGWIDDSRFQEVNITDGRVLFEWSAIEHVDPFEGYVGLKASDISGDGLSPSSAWDSFHINSIDKSDLTGNYLISARHMSSLYNINATDGSIIWQLQAGGKTNFTCTDFNFGFQHDAQIQQENKTHMTISLFDNASNNVNNTADFSTGKVFTIDYAKKTASISMPITNYPSNPPLLCASQGNTKFLPGGNIFHGWGSWPFMSEHTPDSLAVWAANFAPYQGVTMSYRAFAGNWSAIPNNTAPAVMSFSKYTDASCAFYVSWDGCTEVGSWNFYTAHEKTDPFKKIGTTDKTGFETMYISDTHYDYVIVEAVGKDGTALRNSSIATTFIPGSVLAPSCNDVGCDPGGFADSAKDAVETASGWFKSAKESGMLWIGVGIALVVVLISTIVLRYLWLSFRKRRKAIDESEDKLLGTDVELSECYKDSYNGNYKRRRRKSRASSDSSDSSQSSATAVAFSDTPSNHDDSTSPTKGRLTLQTSHPSRSDILTSPTSSDSSRSIVASATRRYQDKHGDQLLERAASDGHFDIAHWPRVLEDILKRFHDIVHHDFPPSNIAAPPQSRHVTPPASQPQLPVDTPTPQAEQTSTNPHHPDKENDPPSSPPQPSNTSLPTFPLPPSSLSLPTTISSAQGSAITTLPSGTITPPNESAYAYIRDALSSRFSTAPPHTIQRLAELILRPKRHYRFLHTYLSAVDRVVSVSSGTTIFPLPAVDTGSASGPLANGTTPSGNTATTQSSDEGVGGAMLTPIPWLRSENGSDGSASGSPLHPSGSRPSTLVNTPTSSSDTSTTLDRPAEPANPTGAVTQGELLRTEQRTTSPPAPVSSLPSRSPTSHTTISTSTDTGSSDEHEHEQPHARGPDEIGPEDTGLQGGSLGGGQVLDIDAAVGRTHEESHPGTGSVHHATVQGEEVDVGESAAGKAEGGEGTSETRSVEKDGDGDVIIADVDGRVAADEPRTQSENPG